ncbi:energy-coupling factor ABC transporter ATP-binding protein [Arcanobacterium phocisimile]|uniref:Energy-coupling factor ABC transporter ATP-binding protein n=1 Tax=Arcanobacterium phocisimile TaxID=1302235 RepID=A0ABX7IEV7_9ACTO|nr:energy-coupling factor ABC transporter ATP-binding protein [Arcanobacterium phocisimile]QRV01663.1 energy-coupling factor ABC transporter ATP-binding protein [Arcanobacterium phocisimile]
MTKHDNGEVNFDDVCFAYPAPQGQQPSFVFQHVNLHIPAGSCTLFCGPSGSGKSTALKMINGLIPQLQPGHMSGSVTVSGHKVDDVDLTDIGKTSATVFQNPRTQFFTGHVLAEIAYAGENYRVPSEQLWDRCIDAAKETGTYHLLERSLHTLSGGQLQSVAQASGLATMVPVLLFDEPTSNLSPEAIDNFSTVLRRQKAAGKTIIIAEHRLYFLRDLVDQVVYFYPGSDPEMIDGPTFFAFDDAERRRRGLRVLDLPKNSAIPRVETGMEHASQPPITTGVSLRNLNFSYPGHEVLHDFSVDLPAGKITALTGANGVGKTTLARLLCGLLKPQSGRIYLDGQPRSPRALSSLSSIVMQDVHRQLFANSVIKEVTLGSDTDVEAESLLEQLGLLSSQHRHPLALSGGQKQRLVIAAALATRRRLVIFDEPTSGVDYRQLQAISSLFRQLADCGHIIVVITHDKELLASCADRILHLDYWMHSITSNLPHTEDCYER